LLPVAHFHFLNPVEMNNKDKAMVVNKVRKSKYAMLFDSVYGRNTRNTRVASRIRHSRLTGHTRHIV
jgi:cytochrome c peroxidase